MIRLLKYFCYTSFVFLLIMSCAFCCWGKVSGSDDQLKHSNLVKEFYHRKDISRFWFADNKQSASLREAFKRMLDSCSFSGLERSRYHYDEITRIVGTLSHAPYDNNAEELFTDAVISYFTDLQRGVDITGMLSYDGISPKYIASDDSFLLIRLVEVKNKEDLISLAKYFESCAPGYLKLKAELAKQLQ